MTMTRQDFEFIARVLSEAKEDEYDGTVTDARIEALERELARKSIARRFSRELARTNPRFDGHRFLAACGVAV